MLGQERAESLLDRIAKKSKQKKKL
jgi:hypothetical protein